jgi:formate dehydrogenase beta subunit
LERVTLTINGCDIQAQSGQTVLEAALAEGIYIPHLCHHPDLPSIGACRLCVVEIEGVDSPSASCVTPVANGMKIETRTERLDRMRRLAIELMLAGHPSDCSTCNKYLNCELQSLKQYFGIEELRVRRRTKPFPIARDNPLFVHDFSRCVLCGRCVRACHELRGVEVLFYKKKREEFYIGTAADLALSESGCRFCGACAEVCPTGAIMDKEELIQGKNRKNALVPCKFACPAEIDVPRYIRCIRNKDYSAAIAVIREKVPFPGVLGYVCSRPCETVCRRNLINQSVSIRDLKRYAAGHDQQRRWERQICNKPSTGKRVAIIGSGPAGLTAAYCLAKQGHAITVFESLPLPGGMMRYGIPEYRLPREVLDSEISYIETMGVEIKTQTHIESIDSLFDDGYNAVLIAVGTHKSQQPSIPGVDSEGVYFCIDFLRKVNLGACVEVGKRVVVLGGGNAAFDCARVARRLGAEHVHVACIEERANMPASRDEIEQAEAEGIHIHPSKTASRILANDRKVAGIEFLGVESFCFDEEGSLQLEIVEDSFQTMEADTAVFAIGQEPEIPEGFALERSAGGFIEVDPYTWQTCREGVFAAGDAVKGAGSLIEAIASGKKGAMFVDSFLEGNGVIDESPVPPLEPDSRLGPGAGFASMQRCRESCAPPEQRISDFRKVVEEMDEQTAIQESTRCLQCDLRLKIASVKMWGNY